MAEKKKQVSAMKNVENIFTLQFIAFSAALVAMYFSWKKDLKIKFMIYHSGIATPTRIKKCVGREKRLCMLRVGNREITHEISTLALSSNFISLARFS